MLIQLPGGTAIDPEGQIVSAEDNGEIRLHTPQALSRLIEFWKNKPNLRALLADYIDEIQEIENAIWDVIVLRLPAYASGAQLDSLGAIVGEPRNSLGDAEYRVHIQARIAINNSLGRAKDVINILRLIESARFKYIEGSRAYFLVAYVEPFSHETSGRAIPKIVAEARAAGVGAYVTYPLDATRGGLWNDSTAPNANQNAIWGDVTDSTAGAQWACGVSA